MNYKNFLIFLVFFASYFANSQEISWLKINTTNNQVLYKSESDNLIRKLSRTTEFSSESIDFPVNNNLLSFDIVKNNVSNQYNLGETQTSNYIGITKDNKNKVFLNIIGDLITITIHLENSRVHLSNVKNKNNFVYKEIDTNNENNGSLDCDAQHDHSSYNSSKKKKTIFNNLDPVGKSPNLVKYRIAISPTAEWSNYYIDLYDAQDLSVENKKAIVLSELAISVSELNDISGRDLSILFELIPENDRLIVFDTNLDGFTHGDKYAQLGESINKLNNTIGFNSFDIGHVFDSYNYGGVAYVGSIATTAKAGGVTGGVNSTGFYFVFAHEIGHQLGAWHTFNSDSTDGVEIGSGVSIMAYGPRELENLFYHSKSIKAITNTINNRNAGVNVSDYENTMPYYSVEPPSLSFTVPTGTPLVLGENFEIKDNEQSTLLFNWDQLDRQLGVNPPINTQTVGPMFVSKFPENEQKRYLPNLQTVLEGSTQNELEVIPQLSREMNFTLTARDDNPGGGAVIQEDFVINFVKSEYGTFKIFSQNTNGLNVNQNEEILIRWNHLAAPFTDFVDIDISYDGGNFFSYNLAESTPNDGEEILLIPQFNKSNNARIRVKASDNIFYAINAADFIIDDPKFLFNITNPSAIECYGATTSIEIDPVGGAGPPYDVLWEKLDSDNNWVLTVNTDNNPKVLSDISPGSYRVIVKDKESVSYTSSQIIANGPTEKLELETTFSKINLDCFGDNDGQVVINPKGGTMPYTLLLNDEVISSGLKPNDSYILNDLSFGLYNLQIIDGNGCYSEKTSFEVTQPQFELKLENFEIINSNDDDGSISIEIQGGSPGYTYEWSGPDEFSSNDQNISELKPGNYSLIVTDANNCKYFNEFVIEEEGDFNYNLSITNVLCKGSQTGQIVARPSGGSGAPYNFEWYDSSNKLLSTQSSVNNLAAGTYTLKVIDSENEDFPLKEIQIEEPNESIDLLVSSVINVDCKGDNTGKFELSIIGGKAPYVYILNGQEIQSSLSTAGNNEKIVVENNLNADVYNIQIIDSNGCSSTIQTVITEPEYELNIKSETITNISKFNSNDGSIKVDIEGGTINNQDGYRYVWTGPDNFSSSLKNIFNLKLGSYNLKVYDVNDCFTEKNFEIKSPNSFSFGSVIINSPTCFDGDDGKIDISFTGGYGAPYTVKWKKKINNNFVSVDDNSPNNNSLENIRQGTYKLEIIDSEDISYLYDDEIIVESVDEFKLSSASNIIAESCPGSEDGQFTINVSGGTAPYSYYFDNELLVSGRGDSSNNDEFTVENLSKKEYVFYAVDSKGCVTSPTIVSIGGYDPIIIPNEEYAVTDISCVNGNDGKIELIVQGGDYSGNFSYQWTGPNGFNATSKDINNLSEEGTYQVTVTQGNCEINKEFELKEPEELTATVNNINHAQCGSDGSFQININGGTPPYTVWGYTYNETSLFYSNQGPGTKNITVTDANNCKVITLNPEILGSSNNLDLDIEKTTSCDSSLKNEIKLTLSGGDFFLDGSAEYYKVNITGPNKNENLNLLENIQYTFSNLDDGSYIIRVTERDHTSSNDSDVNGCINEEEVYISSDVEWSGKSLTNITCVDQNNNPSNDGKVIYSNFSGGKPFVENSSEYYKYELEFKGSVLDSGNVDLSENLEFSNLEAGIYKFTVEEANNCISEDIFEILSPSKLDLSIEKVIDACYDPQLKNQKGKVDFIILNGIAPYDLYLIDSQNNEIDTGLSGGDSIGQNTVGWDEELDGLDPGEYSLKFIDSNGCEIVSDLFTIGNYDEFKVESIVTTDVTCSGAQDGVLKIPAISGGLVPYRIIFESSNSSLVERTINNENEEAVFQNLSPGNYTLRIEDNLGICGVHFEDFEILEPSPVQIETIDKIDQKCFDYGDGSIEISLSGGLKIGETVQYNLNWYKNDVYIPSYENLYKIEGLDSGNYRVDVEAIRTVNDIEIKCSSYSSSFVIEKPQRLYASENKEKHVDINCNSEANGQFEIYFNGGRAPYKVISNGAVVAGGLLENTFLFTEMMAGNYEIDVIDSNGCKFSEAVNPNTNEFYGLINIELVQPEKILEIETKFLDLSCPGSNDGEVEIFVSGGRAPYNIEWITDVSYEVLESDDENGYYRIKSSPGLISATINDSTNNCGSLSSTITIKEPDQLLINSVSKENNLCFNEYNGTYETYVSGLIDESVVGIFYKYYKLNGENYELVAKYSTQDGVTTTEGNDEFVTTFGYNTTTESLKIMGLPNGEYKLVVGRARIRKSEEPQIISFCETEAVFSITSPEKLKISEFSSNDISCERLSGDYTFNLDGGLAPYNLIFDDVLFKNINLDESGNYSIKELELGTYKIQVYDNNNCFSQEITFEINELVPNYELIYEEIDTNNNNFIEGNKPLCYNGLGSFYFEIENNLSSAALRYYLNDKEIFLDGQITNDGDGYLVTDLELDKHEFTIIDDQGACYTIDFEILNNEKIRLLDEDIFSYVEQRILCADDQVDTNLNLGIIDVSDQIVGGQIFNSEDFDYKFYWKGPNFSSDKTRIEVSEPGIYTLSIEDELGCRSETYEFDLSIDEIKFNSTTKNVNGLCIVTNPDSSISSDDTSLGFIELQPEGGSGILTVEWYESDEDGNLINLISNSEDIYNLNEGHYAAIITDNINGCKVIEDYHVINEKVYILELPTISESLCYMTNGLAYVKLANPYNNTFEFKYNNEPVDAIISYSSTDYKIYELKIENPISDGYLSVSNEYGCSYSYLLNLGVGEVNFQLTNNGKTIDGATLDDATNGKIASNTDVIIENKSDGKWHEVEYDFGDGSPTVRLLREDDQIQKHAYPEDGYYTINMKIFSEQGCYKELSKTLLVGIGYKFEVPNAFTPNNDRVNDVFRPIFNGFIKGSFYVFSVSGLNLYTESFDISNDISQEIELEGWDASNMDYSQKIYYFQFLGETLDGKEVIKSNYFRAIY